MKETIALLLIVGAVTTGCSTFTNKREFIKTYDGPALQETESALLKPAVGIVIKAIDGKAIKFTAVRPGSSNVDADISFSLTTHQITVGYFVHVYNGWKASKGDLTITFSPMAAHRYILNADENKQNQTWSAEIIDVTEKPDLWCLWVYGKCAPFNPGQSAPIPDQEKM